MSKEKTKVQRRIEAHARGRTRRMRRIVRQTEDNHQARRLKYQSQRNQSVTAARGSETRSYRTTNSRGQVIREEEQWVPGQDV